MAEDTSMHPAMQAELVDPCPPSLKDRALSMPFLLATIGKNWPVGRRPEAAHLKDQNVATLDDAGVIPCASDGRPLRELLTWEVAERFIKPATSRGICSFVQAFHKSSLVEPPYVAGLMCSTHVHLDHWRTGDIDTWRDLTGNPKFVCEYGVREYDEMLPPTGPVTWFVSHTWSRPWVELVDAVWQHYLQQEHTVCAPGHWNGEREIRVLPMYFWVDIFAVSQQILNTVGAVSKHPDCQFAEVIAASRGTLFTLTPWQAPVTVSRVWCLFEVMKTLQAGTKLALVPDRAFWEASTEVSLDSINQLLRVCIDTLDVSTASASFPADREAILSQIQKLYGYQQFNQELRQPMRSKVMEAVAMRSLNAKDHEALKLCAENGAVLVRPSIDLQHARIGPLCGLQLGRILVNNQHLVNLALSGNLIGDDAVVCLAGAMATMGSLKNVDVGANDITEKGGLAIADAIKSARSRTWEIICLDKNRIGDAAGVAIAEAAARSQSFVGVWCKWNGLSDAAVARMRAVWEEAGKDLKKMAVEAQ